MNVPPEQIGAAPQSGVNPMAKQAPAPQGQDIPPEAIQFFRNDPEIIAAVSKFMGKPVTLEHVPDDMLIALAGMVQKLGVDGAVAMAQKTIPPEQQQQLRAAV